MITSFDEFVTLHNQIELMINRQETERTHLFFYLDHPTDYKNPITGQEDKTKHLTKVPTSIREKNRKKKKLQFKLT